MPVFDTLMIIIAIGSVGVALVTLNRVIAYNRKYPLPESKFTRLFGILNKEHVTGIYLFSTLVHVIFILWFLYTL